MMPPVVGALRCPAGPRAEARGTLALGTPWAGREPDLRRRHRTQVGEALGKEVAGSGSPPGWAVDLCVRTHQALDLNGNGTVNHDEYAVWLRAIGSTADSAEVFTRLDLNGDGVVSLPEMIGLFAQFALSEDPAEPGNYLMTGTF